jgi:SAM-dependent methyltransferase
MPDAAEVFGAIYETDRWQGGSGAGSTASASAPYRHVVQRLLASVEVRSVVDVGCGDWQVGSLIDWAGVRYTGLDVVGSVVEADARRFGSRGIRFEQADVRISPPPRADLLLIKDVLQHWPNGDIQLFLSRTVPRYRYALITNDIASVHYPGQVNEDIEMGASRALDLLAPPFDLHAVASWDYDVSGEWTKRILLVCNTFRWTLGKAIPRSVRRIAPSVVF